MKPLRLIVLGTAASLPFPGMAWMHMQIAAGLRRLGHDVYYFEVTSTWPFDPIRDCQVDDSDYALPYLARLTDRFGIGDRWAYRRSYSDHEWFGLTREAAEARLASADAVLNVAGATHVRSDEGLRTNVLVHFGTDPVPLELMLANGDPRTTAMVDEHDMFVTYGENIGTDRSPIPPFPRLKSRTRQAVLMDYWDLAVEPQPAFTTVANWKQGGGDICYQGEVYRWSKHHEFLKFIELPTRVAVPIELAVGLDDRSLIEPDEDVPEQPFGMTWSERKLLERNGWRLRNAYEFTTDPWRRYREYLCASRGEFTVARDQNVRLRSGWFSERSACYLAAARPVITQDTGFGDVLPTGEGLFAFNTMEDVLAAFDAINSDYDRHSRAARDIAHEYFRAETVLARMLDDLQL